MEAKGKIAILRVIDWIFYTENALKCLGNILNYFKDIFISEFWDNNYKIKIKKNSSNNSTIGFLFGLLEDQVIKENYLIILFFRKAHAI